VKFVGIDGCKAGWLAVGVDAQDKLTHQVIREADQLNEVIDGAKKVFIDIPLGMNSEEYTRECDRLLRSRLGSDYSSSIFDPPIRPALHAPTYAEACMQSYSITEKKVTLQSWNITPKIREVDQMLQEHTELRSKVYESHPEFLFLRLNGGDPLQQKKKTKKGLRHRLSLIVDRHGDAKDMFRDLKEEYRRNEIGEDDIVDAMVLAHFAWRSREEEIKTLPEDPPQDETGITMAIAYL
jgi:predicted RNase H-like nuclease